MRHTRHGSSAATLLCRCTDARTCATRPRASPRTARLDSITSRRAGRLLPRRVDAGDNAGVAGGGGFLAGHPKGNTCASHSEQVLQVTWQWWKSSAGAPMWLVEDLAIVSDTLQQGIAALVHSLNGQSGLFWTETITTVIRCALLSASKLPLPFCCAGYFIAGATTVCADHCYRAD